MSRLMIFTKPARPGKVKTRLIGELSSEQAAELHRAFLGDVCERLAGGRFDLRIAWALDPGEAIPDAGELGVPGMRQEGADLGARLYHALAAASREAETVAAVGSDHPELEPATVEDAFRRLAGGTQVVLGPAADGGYYLIGLRPKAVRRELFRDIAWSTETVLRTTLDRCRRLGLSVELLPPGHDVDTPADLRRLAARLAAGEEGCPRTRSLLRAWGRL